MGRYKIGDKVKDFLDYEGVVVAVDDGEGKWRKVKIKYKNIFWKTAWERECDVTRVIESEE